MARYGQRPENVLNRANEFIEVGKPSRALDTLQEVFRNKKWADNCSESVLEPIMFRYLDLCVELKKSHIAKEGLFQYGKMFQSVNAGSVENVIRGYLRMAEKKTDYAREHLGQAVIDIENLATPESILLSVISGEDAQNRSDHTIFTPWVKFLWDSYCQCLELLRTNAILEHLYHDVARMAFQFCLKYNRKTEFKELGDKLRKHMKDICKLPAHVANVSMSKPQTQQLNLQTRLHELDFAIQMELWQEAYKAIESINNLLNLSKKMPVPKTMAIYYQKLAMVFWKAGNYLFHAAALFKLLQLSKEMKKNITHEELQKTACRVLIATLGIPLSSAHPEFDNLIKTDNSPLKEAQRLSTFLGLMQPPTRASLLKDLVRENVVNLVTPELQDLYRWLEVDFDPVNLCPHVQSVIHHIKEDGGGIALQQYIPTLQDVALVRLIRQIAQVYQTIEFSRLLDLAKFTTHFHMERLLVDCVRHNDMQIRIDHGRHCIHFGPSDSQREDKPGRPTLQAMPSEQVLNPLVNIYSVLNQAINVINPNRKKLEGAKLRATMVQNYHETKVKEHQKILQRQKISEDRKSCFGRINIVREEEEQKCLEEIQRQQMLAEQIRLEEEKQARERRHQLEQVNHRNRQAILRQIRQTRHAPRNLKKLKEADIKKLEPDQLADLCWDLWNIINKDSKRKRDARQLQRIRHELQAMLTSQETPNQHFWEQQATKTTAAAIVEREWVVATGDRFAGIKPDQDKFLAHQKKERSTVYYYEEKLYNLKEMLSSQERDKLAEIKVKRKVRRAKWLEEGEDRKPEQQKMREEKEKQRQETLERERLEKEEIEREAREKQEMLDYTAAKQRSGEEDIGFYRTENCDGESFERNRRDERYNHRTRALGRNKRCRRLYFKCKNDDRSLEEIHRQQMLDEQKRERRLQLNLIDQSKHRQHVLKVPQIKQMRYDQNVLEEMDDNDIKELDEDQIATKEAERRKLQAKLKLQEKKVHCFELAKRQVEINLLQESFKERQLQDRHLWEQQEKEKIGAAIEERKLAVATRDRFARIKPDWDEFLAKLKKEKNAVYEETLHNFEEMLPEERKKKLAERKATRKVERRARWLNEKQELKDCACFVSTENRDRGRFERNRRDKRDIDRTPRLKRENRGPGRGFERRDYSRDDKGERKPEGSSASYHATRYSEDTSRKTFAPPSRVGLTSEGSAGKWSSEGGSPRTKQPTRRGGKGRRVTVPDSQPQVETDEGCSKLRRC